MATALEQACADGLAAVREREAALAMSRLYAPVIKLWDGNINLQYVVRCENEYDWLDVENDTGTGVIKIDAEYEEAQWLWDIRGPQGSRRNHRHPRHCRLRRPALVRVPRHRRYGNQRPRPIHRHRDFLIRLRAAEVAGLVGYADHPQQGFSRSRYSCWVAPTDWALGTALKLNLARAHGWPSGMGWNDPLADGGDADYTDWPIVLAPLDYETAATRGTVTGLVLSRFKTWHECAESMLHDADLTVRWRRYMPGDPLPWEGAQVAHGTLVIWFENNSGGSPPRP